MMTIARDEMDEWRAAHPEAADDREEAWTLVRGTMSEKITTGWSIRAAGHAGFRISHRDLHAFVEVRV